MIVRTQKVARAVRRPQNTGGLIRSDGVFWRYPPAAGLSRPFNGFGGASRQFFFCDLGGLCLVRMTGEARRTSTSVNKTDLET